MSLMLIECDAPGGSDPVEERLVAGTAVQALELSLQGEQVAARQLLCGIDEAAQVAVMADLLDVAVAALDALSDRARYLVDVDVVRRWLRTVDPDRHEACGAMLQRAAFRCAGLHLADTRPPVADDELVDALVVASALIALVARRRWVRPLQMLTDLTTVTEPVGRTG